jgi:COP9 signalosome complex subunit 1
MKIMCLNCIFFVLRFSPYLSADLRLMASCFNTSLSALEEEIMNLILDGQIQARIDSHNKVGAAA